MKRVGNADRRDFKSNLHNVDLEKILCEVIEPRERHVRDNEDSQYWLRVRSYRTAKNKIDGAVITLLDVHQPKERSARAKVTANSAGRQAIRF